VLGDNLVQSRNHPVIQTAAVGFGLNGKLRMELNLDTTDAWSGATGVNVTNPDIS
jgi:hypothetical protein